MKKAILASAVAALVLGSGAASAATGEFCMFDGTGAPVNGGWATTCDQGVTANLGMGSLPTNEIASPNVFFGSPWDAHDITLYGAGTHTVDTIEAGLYTFTVGAGQIGGHMLFDWGVVSDIDVINVWDVTEGATRTYTSTDWDGDGILGGAMIDGAFVGFSANFNLVGNDLPPAVPVPAAVWLFGSGLVGLAGIARRKKAA